MMSTGYIINWVSRLKKFLSQRIIHFLQNNSAQPNNEFYRISPTCQIPYLEHYYLNYFGKKTNGCFVEVGAYDGETFSNTSGLADAGWDGLYIEPIPHLYEKCKSRHVTNRKVKVLNLAVSNKEEVLTMSVGGALSTARIDVRKNFEKMGWKKHFEGAEVIQVVAQPLNRILESNKVPRGFDVLVIDVEGFELNVMQSFEINKWRPQMIIIELHDQNRNYRDVMQENFKLAKIFHNADYHAVFKNMSNTIFVAEEVYDLSVKRDSSEKESGGNSGSLG